jgi:hypothetical protein
MAFVPYFAETKFSLTPVQSGLLLLLVSLPIVVTIADPARHKQGRFD